MFKKITALFICALLVAGCAASVPASSSAPASSAPSSSEAAPAEGQTVYTYKNPDPDMVMATAPSGDITYKDYRLYVDVSENIAKHNARQNAAVAAVLEYDLKQKGVEIDEQEFKALADTRVDTIRSYYTDFEEELGLLADIAGLTADEIIDGIKFGFRSDFLVEKMGAVIEAEAAEEYAPVAVSSESSGENAVDPELIKQKGIYDLASRKMEQYSKEMNSRLSFDKENVLVTIDGVDIEYSAQTEAFIKYSAAAARLDSVSFIQQGELMLRALEEKGIKLDIDTINADHDAYISNIKASPDQLQRLSDICAPLGATADDYLEGLRRAIVIETATNRYYEVVDEEYGKLVEENTNDKGEVSKDIPSPDQYYVDGIKALMEGSELVNIAGK